MRIFNKNLFALEFRRAFKGMLVWSISLGLTMYLIVILYPYVKDMYAAIPPELSGILDSFGGLPENVTEYFATECAMMLQIFGSIYVVLEGFNAINRDEKEKTLEAIYVLPYRRDVILFTKFVRITLNILLFSIANILFSLAGFWTVGEFAENGRFFLFALLNTLMFLMIGYLGLAMVCLMKPNQKNMISMLIPIPLYIVSVISTLTNNEWLQKLKYITPFTFANPVEILKTDFAFEWENLVGFTLVTICLLVAAFLRFRKREFIV